MRKFLFDSQCHISNANDHYSMSQILSNQTSAFVCTVFPLLSIRSPTTSKIPNPSTLPSSTTNFARASPPPLSNDVLSTTDPRVNNAAINLCNELMPGSGVRDGHQSNMSGPETRPFCKQTGFIA